MRSSISVPARVILSAALVVQAGVFLAGDRLAVDERDGHDAGEPDLEREAAAGGERDELRLERLLPGVRLGEGFAAAAVVVLALERARDLAPGGGDELLHVGGELRPAAGRQANRLRPVGCGEVVDVDPVVGHGERRRLALQVVERGGASAGAGCSGDEEVEPVCLDAEPELDRVERPRLADRADERRDLRRRPEGEGGRVEGAAQLVRSQLEPAAAAGPALRRLAGAGGGRHGFIVAAGGVPGIGAVPKGSAAKPQRAVLPSRAGFRAGGTAILAAAPT